MGIPSEAEPVVVIEGDNTLILPTLPADSFDGIVCDPPYGLEFMGKEWDSFRGEAWRVGAGFSSPGIGERKTPWPSFGSGDSANATCEVCGGRMRGANKCECDDPDWRVKGEPLAYRNGKAEQMRAFQTWCGGWASAALRVLKPGGYMLAMGGTRTYHRLACAVEDAGFEVRDCIFWLHGQGFPKGKACLKPAVEPVLVCQKPLDVDNIIVGSLSLLEAQLWSLLPADIAAGLSSSIRVEPTGEPNSVPPSAAPPPISLGDLSGLMGTSRFASAVCICLSIVSSWRNTLAEVCDEANTSTTAVGTRPTIDWKTLNSCLSALTPQSIIRAELQAPGSRLSALHAARYLNAACANISATRELSALDSAISRGLISPQDGTALDRSPAWEPILLARKPGPKVLPLGIDGCRTEYLSESDKASATPQGRCTGKSGALAGGVENDNERTDFDRPALLGRWPANVVHDGSDEVMEAFAAFGERNGGHHPKSRGKGGLGCNGHGGQDELDESFSDTGTAARFFYCAKASRSERGEGNTHPTVKPLALMRWLVRLVCPVGGTVLDHFAGSGTTLVAAAKEGMNAVGIERDPHYAAICRRRVAEAMCQGAGSLFKDVGPVPSLFDSELLPGSPTQPDDAPEPAH